MIGISTIHWIGKIEVKMEELHGVKLILLFLIRTMEQAREAIKEDRFLEFEKEVMEKFGSKRGF